MECAVGVYVYSEVTIKKKVKVTHDQRSGGQQKYVGTFFKKGGGRSTSGYGLS